MVGLREMGGEPLTPVSLDKTSRGRNGCNRFGSYCVLGGIMGLIVFVVYGPLR